MIYIEKLGNFGEPGSGFLVTVQQTVNDNSFPFGQTTKQTQRMFTDFLDLVVFIGHYLEVDHDAEIIENPDY